MSSLKITEGKGKDFRTVQNVPKAALAVLLIDSKSDEIVWMSRAIGEVKYNGKDDAKGLKRLQYAIEKMFSNFQYFMSILVF